MRTLSEVKKFCVEKIDSDEYEGSRFKWHIDKQAFTYGWCAINPEGDRFTTQTDAVYLNFFSFVISSIDAPYFTSAEVIIEKPLFFNSDENSYTPIIRVELNTKGICHFSKHQVNEIVKYPAGEDFLGSRSLDGNGEIRFQGMQDSKAIEDTIHLLSS